MTGIGDAAYEAKGAFAVGIHIAFGKYIAYISLSASRQDAELPGSASSRSRRTSSEALLGPLRQRRHRPVGVGEENDLGSLQSEYPPAFEEIAVMADGGADHAETEVVDGPFGGLAEEVEFVEGRVHLALEPDQRPSGPTSADVL